MKTINLCIVTLLLLTLGLCSLQVYMPTCASTEMSQQVNYTLANFGHIPYGRTIIGQLIIPKNQQFCNLDQSQNLGNLQTQDVKRFLLVKRGNCKFTKKILNGQQKGADMVIVYDHQKTYTPNIVMSNDGHGHLIDISSIFISNVDGQKLIKTYEKCSKSTILRITFDVYASRIANLTFWLDINNRESFITIRDFYRDYYKVIANYLNVDVKFKINAGCGLAQCQPDDCVKKNQLCLHTDKTIQGVPVKGKQLISQQLRSYFLFKALKQKNQVNQWFQYMNQFDQGLCLQKTDLRDCSYSIIKKYQNSDNIQAKVAETYANITAQKQNVLDKFFSDAYNSDILFYPQASINGRNYYGLFRAPDIFQMTCQSLERPPKQCHSFVITDGKQIFGRDSTNGLWKTILLIILCTILLFFAALFIYNRLIRRQLNQQMSMQVNKMVEHYVAMTEQKSRSNANM